jgi:hypothetical protein
MKKNKPFFSFIFFYLFFSLSETISLHWAAIFFPIYFMIIHYLSFPLFYDITSVRYRKGEKIKFYSKTLFQN